MKVGQHEGWPSLWRCDRDKTLWTIEVRQYGVLTGVFLSPNHGIQLQIDCHGLRGQAYFLPKDHNGELSDLTDRIALYVHRPMREVENIEI